MRALEEIRKDLEEAEERFRASPTDGSLAVARWRLQQEKQKAIKRERAEAKKKGEKKAMAEQEEKAFFTAEEIAKVLQVTKMTVYRLLDRGEIPFYQIGKMKRIRKDDFEAFLAKNRREGEGHGRDE